MVKIRAMQYVNAKILEDKFIHLVYGKMEDCCERFNGVNKAIKTQVLRSLFSSTSSIFSDVIEYCVKLTNEAVDINNTAVAALKGVEKREAELNDVMSVKSEKSKEALRLGRSLASMYKDCEPEVLRSVSSCVYAYLMGADGTEQLSEKGEEK